MMAAAQPFLSGAISKTVNLPESATVEDIMQAYIEAWQLGLKAVAVYRDGSKRSAPLNTKRTADSGTGQIVEDFTEKIASLAQENEALRNELASRPRRTMPDTRMSLTHKFEIAGHEGYITVGLYPDGQPGELFVQMSKEGSTIGGLMDTVATLTSISLQYGVPLEQMVKKFAYQRFEPSGFTANPDIRAAGIERLSLSLDGATRETHDTFRRIPGTFDRTLKAMELAAKADISIQINTTLTKGNLHEFTAFRDLMFQWKPAMWSVFILVPTGRAGAADMPEPDALESVFEEMADLIGTAPFGIKTTEGHHFRRVLAQRGKGGPAGRKGFRAPLGIRDGRGVMFISHTGIVSPSGFLPIDCGNARDRDVGEIYRNHPLFVSLRDSDALGGKCGRCEFRKICGGSRARAYGLTGDPFAEDPSCSYQPSSRRADSLHNNYKKP
jgi:radical SAM protein with 4Fe4S-binding SPASM domain